MTGPNGPMGAPSPGEREPDPSTDPPPDSLSASTEPAPLPPSGEPPSQAEPAPPVEPTPNPSATVSASAPGPIPGWRQSGAASSGRMRMIGCIILAVVVGIPGLALASIIGLIFLGGQVQSILAGTVIFGTDGSGCIVSGASNALPASGPIYIAGNLEREVRPGETVAIEVVTEGERLTLSEERVATASQCVYLEIPPGNGAPGTYTFEFIAGNELLASGTIELTP